MGIFIRRKRRKRTKGSIEREEIPECHRSALSSGYYGKGKVKLGVGKLSERGMKENKKKRGKREKKDLADAPMCVCSFSMRSRERREEQIEALHHQCLKNRMDEADSASEERGRRWYSVYPTLVSDYTRRGIA